MDNRILIAEDEPKLRAILCDYFRSKDDVPVGAADGLQALELAETEDFDAILLDIMMPGLDGFAVCRAVRRRQDTPILFLTALSDEEDKLYGYELGADDYITKPYSLSVLYAKTAALIRRSRGALRTDGCLESGGVTLDLTARRVWADGGEVTLTPKEFSLLHCLMVNRGLVLSREQLLVKCWGYDYEGESRAVDTHIRRLRDKLGAQACHIRTVIKSGYRWEEGEV